MGGALPSSDYSGIGSAILCLGEEEAYENLD
jgi:hypothetical protein